MLLSYVVSCLYILTLGVYWIINFAKFNILSERGLIPGILISLICLCALLLLIIVSIVYFCYLRYKVRLNIKQIVSKTMNHTNKVFITLMCIDIALGIVVYVFTVLEEFEDLIDFIKLHCLFIIMILFVSTFNGLRWFELQRKWEIILFSIFLGFTAGLLFLDFNPNKFSELPPNRKAAKQQIDPYYQFIRPMFQQYISGPLIVAYEYMYLSLGPTYVVQNVICKLVQYLSIGVFARRFHDLIEYSVDKNFFNFDFIWAVIVGYMALIFIIKDVYKAIKCIIEKRNQKNQERYIQQIREQINSYLFVRCLMIQSEIDLTATNQCIICLENIKEEQKQVKLDCGHWFHFNCVFQWFNKETTCPVCRSQFDILS